jgi:hypothetical protein
MFLSGNAADLNLLQGPLAGSACFLLSILSIGASLMRRQKKKSNSNTRQAVIDELVVYPIKGCRGFSVPSAVLTPRGLEHDRCFMVVKAGSGKFISQRSHARTYDYCAAVLFQAIIAVNHCSRVASSSSVTRRMTSSKSKCCRATFFILGVHVCLDPGT